MEKFFYRGIISIFIFFLFSGLIFTFMPPYTLYSEMEGRPYFVLKPQAISVPNTFSGALFQNIAAMVEDQFPLRKAWIEAYAKGQSLIGKKIYKK